MKSKIIEELGQSDILLPALIAEGLAANDQVKARLSVLQAASERARKPHGPPYDLKEECRGAGIDAVAMEDLVNGAALIADGRIAAPGLEKLGSAIWDDVATMIRAIAAGDAGEGGAFLQRLSAIRDKSALGSPDPIAPSEIAALTGLSEKDGDSLHRLVMDLHKALNRLSADHAEEIVAGAHVFGLLPEDRKSVEAFMRGVEATRRLKFGHPGLGTTATRSGARLSIQNDIGETDAHVVVIAVDPEAVTITYTDVHLARAEFFTGLLKAFPVQWSGLDRRTAEGFRDGAFYLLTGRYAIADAAHRDAFLETVGASLVFLIDWNKTRKVLRLWVSKGDAEHILEWAARSRVGQRGFLVLGGSELIASAVRHAASARIGFGERLDSALGREATVDFLKTVLRVSTETLLEGSSVRLAKDRIEADLVRHLERIEATLLAVVVRQAGLAREIAAGIAGFVAEQKAGRAGDGAGLAERARRIEEKADRIASEARSEIARLEADPGIEVLVNRLEDAIDELEQAAFVTSLVPDGLAADLLKPLSDLCDDAVAGAEAAAAGAVAAAEVPEGHRVDSEDALAAVGRLIDAEHKADAAERRITAMVFGGAFDLRTALSVLDLARALERATDRLAGFGHLLRAHVIADLST